MKWKWLKTIAILFLGALAAGLFAWSGQRAVLDPAVEYTIDPDGNLYLLSEGGTLTKTNKQGKLLWSEPLAARNEEGDSLHYSHLLCDRSGSIYLVARAYKRQVDAAGVVRESVLAEEVWNWNGDGEAQNAVLRIDKTELSEQSTESYFQSMQMAGDSLLAACREGDVFHILRAEPYGGTEPEILSSIELGEAAQEVESCVPLADGSLVYTDPVGRLFCIRPGGSAQELSSLAGQQTVAGGLSLDETGCVYYTDLRRGVFYQMDIENNRITRLYSDLTENGLRNAFTLGSGGFCAASVDTKNPYWVRFGEQDIYISQLHNPWSMQRIGMTALVFAGTALLVWLLGWLLRRMSQRSVLTWRIVLHCLPVLVLTLALLCGIFWRIEETGRISAQEHQLAAAARSAAGMLGNEEMARDPRSLDAAQREELTQMLLLTQRKSASISRLDTELGLVLYAAEDNFCWGLCASRPRDSFTTVHYMAPLVQELPGPAAQAALTYAENEGGSVSFYQNGREYISYFQPVEDAGGHVVGLVEARLPLESGMSGPAVYICTAGVSACVILLAWLLLALARAFRPLQELGRCIDEISAGNWKVKAEISSQDELAEIGASFNEMTDKLNQYISNMVLLNNEYIKFTPRELFHLMGKSKVTDLQLRDKNVRDVSLLYMNFRTPSVQTSSDTYFSMINEHFDKIFDIVEKNRGIILRFDGSGMLALFPWQVRDALNSAISLKESMMRDSYGTEMKMILSEDDTLIGVAGNRKRQTVIALSETIMEMYALNSLMDQMGSQYIITRQAVERVPQDCYFNCREIGAGDSGRESLFEFLDGMDSYEKKLRLVTREEFEQGIHDYQAGRWGVARKHFANVLQTNEQDRVAMYYLMLCDSKGGQDEP